MRPASRQASNEITNDDIYERGGVWVDDGGSLVAGSRQVYLVGVIEYPLIMTTHPCVYYDPVRI